MDQSEQSDCERLSRDITGLLKSISSGGDVDPLLIVMCCEVIPPSIGEWYDQVLRSMQYTTPVACRPWNRMNAGLVRSTANEICSLLLRSFYLKLMPDRPVFLGPSDAPERLAEKVDAYVSADEDKFWRRFEQICASANFPQWLIVASMADRERAMSSGTALIDDTPKHDESPVTAKELATYARCNDKVIRDALLKCPKESAGKGRSAHRWRYCDALPILQAVDSGRLKGIDWPKTADELTTTKDSNKIPTRTLTR